MTAHGTHRDARPAALHANRALLAVTAVALGLGALAVACAPAPGRPGATAPPVSAAEVDAALRAAGATGPGVPVWVWTRGFVAGDRGAEPLAPARTWVAPTGPPGAPTGTVTVWQDPAGDGRVEPAARDDDAELAAALAAVGPDAALVTDRSDWLVVVEDRVRSLLRPPRTELTGTLSVDRYRTLLAARATADVPADGRVGARPGERGDGPGG